MSDEAPHIPGFMQQMGESITKTSRTLDPAQMAAFFTAILTAKRIYVTGAGRSGLVAKAFALRLMHLGYDSYVVGETITPAFQKGDTLVIFSGSGETPSIVSIGGTARELSGTICVITAMPDSRIGMMADLIVNLGDPTGTYLHDKNSYEVLQLTGKYRSITSAFAPLGTMFETMALVFSDAVISALMEAKKDEIAQIQDRLSNVE
ncbi:MAG: SIS domain-containing protein [Methanomicrobiales archaeon]|nr:SIS domain-containing protein [Methanomicrobiales archaeon]